MDHMSNYEEIKSSDNQPLPILKDPKGCLDLTKIHQKDDGVKEAVILLLQQDPKGCPDDVDIKKAAILQQDPKGCQDIATNHLMKDDIKKTNAFHQDPHQDDVIRDVILQEDFKGCQDDIAKDDLIEKHGLSKETLLLSGEISPSKSEDDQPADDDDDDDDDDDGFQTPTSLESRIPVMTECPPAPKKPRLATNRKDSSVVQQTATIRVIRVTRF